ncbi:5'-nucleotidase SurE [hydrothermal vent metagenome]|uniref:5'-nucleotidase n=1 Tax=hydrothermal vent metagenome TaxID=652676 RepID=A0A3B0VVD2_9ZZZZ
MHFLVSNDDGINATGINALSDTLLGLGKVTVYAPNRDRSGASNSLTLDGPVRIQKIAENRYSVSGTPTDCVHMALTGLMSEEPDMVISGINNAANLGDDVLYSGTVAAAIEGRYLGLPAIAFSLATSHASNQRRYFETAQHFVNKIMQNLKNNPLPQDTILNINFPNLAIDKVKGIKIARLGNRHKAENTVQDIDPRGRKIYWIGAAGPEADAGEGTDFHAIKHGYVSITPMQVDMTKHSALASLKNWSASI